ncbi:putative pyruvate decarboxylase [Francisella tularensis subsp. novicida]|nr:putative indolepyruvate decarboxylase [Francisella tularensis subsp. novicida]KFJ69896.1 putative pyruvate decarboxylase [Francisella tularensis subsp. novicida]
MQIITVSEYLRTRLSELGIKDIIAVTGDYNLNGVEIVINYVLVMLLMIMLRLMGLVKK